MRRLIVLAGLFVFGGSDAYGQEVIEEHTLTDRNLLVCEIAPNIMGEYISKLDALSDDLGFELVRFEETRIFIYRELFDWMETTVGDTAMTLSLAARCVYGVDSMSFTILDYDDRTSYSASVLLFVTSKQSNPRN